jgi:hypothetical protein
VAEEFAGLDFQSIRLENRFVRIMETLREQPDSGSKHTLPKSDIYCKGDSDLACLYFF